MAYDCFISYASGDLLAAESLHRRLEQAGFSVWFDKARLRSGCDWHREIEQACESSRIILPMLTVRWKVSEWTRFETYGSEAVIPLLVEGRWEDVVTPPLARFQNHALTTGDDTLFAAIRTLLAKPRPQKQPRLAHLKYRPNPYFVGREKALVEIHEKLHRTPTAALTQGKVEAVTALGGIGKTTVAREYAEKFWRCYRQILWVDCRAGLEAEFANLEEIVLGRSAGTILKQSDRAARVLQELQQRHADAPSLLILDNAEDEVTVKGWIPSTGDCRTLITSRFTGWSPSVEVHPIWTLESGPARELLVRRGASNASDPELSACDQLARMLGYLPLALEQAGAYVREQGPGFGFVEYLKVYAKAERELLRNPTNGGTDYPDSVYTTWRTTIAHLPPGARAVLRLSAFMAPAPIPFRMFLAGTKTVAEQAAEIAGTNVREALSPSCANGRVPCLDTPWWPRSRMTRFRSTR